MTVREYIDGKGYAWSRRGDNALLNCPFCDPPDTEKKFAINLTNGAWNCMHLNRCGKKGSFVDLQRLLGDTPVRLDGDSHNYLPTRKTFVRPQVEIQPATNPVTEYLYKRGFTDETISYFKIGSTDEDTISIPYYKNGELANVKYRSISNKKKMRQEADSEPTLLNRDNIHGETLRIVEGEFDCMALHEYDIEAVSVPAGAQGHQWIDAEWDYLETFNKIDICFDMDDAGRTNALKVAVRLGEWRCRIVSLPKKDANDCLMSSISADKMWECFDNAIEVKPETIVSADHFRDEVGRLFALGRDLFGVKTPWDKLNDILMGWRPGEVSVWSGKSGAGKSTMLNQVFLDLIKKNIKVCVYSGEMKPSRFLRWAIIQYCGDNGPDNKTWNASLDYMAGRVYVLNVMKLLDPSKMLSDFEYAARRYGVTHFFIDSLMTIVFSEIKEKDKFGAQAEFVSHLTEFAKKFNAHIHLVAHPRKTQFDKDQAGKVDVAGSSDITNLCDNVLILHRAPAGEREKAGGKHSISDAVLEVNKNREFGKDGLVPLFFDENSKCFSEHANKFRMFDSKAAAAGQEEQDDPF